MTHKLSDEVISAIARSLQVAILTGTDVIDNLRAIRSAHPNIGVLNSFATDPVTGTQVKVVLA